MSGRSARSSSGFAGGLVCFYATSFIKHRLKIDDSLDVFAVHGVGGILGTLLTAVFAAREFGGLGLPDGATIASQLWVQLAGVAAAVVWAGVLTLVLAKAVNGIVGLRVSDRDETEGLDLAAHGERGYHL